VAARLAVQPVAPPAAAPEAPRAKLHTACQKPWKNQERYLGKRMLARAKPMTLAGGSFLCP
jgi:hypothetical protein